MKSAPPAPVDLSRRHAALAAAVGLIGVAAVWPGPAASSAAVVVPPPALDTPSPQRRDVAVLAGGCFWGVQGVFQRVQGVSQVLSGYSGGDAAGATYEVVSRGWTDHAESVQIEYDPRVVSYGQLLQIYFSVAHDPTELNRQGPDRGRQYRSTVFATNAEQARIARAYIAQLDAARTFGKPLATTVEPLKQFFPAEPYHQDFLLKHPQHGYIVVNDLPKVEALKRLLPGRWRAEPVRVGGAAGQG